MFRQPRWVQPLLCRSFVHSTLVPWARNGVQVGGPVGDAEGSVAWCGGKCWVWAQPLAPALAYRMARNVSSGLSSLPALRAEDLAACRTGSLPVARELTVSRRCDLSSWPWREEAKPPRQQVIGNLGNSSHTWGTCFIEGRPRGPTGGLCFLCETGSEITATDAGMPGET